MFNFIITLFGIKKTLERDRILLTQALQDARPSKYVGNSGRALDARALAIDAGYSECIDILTRFYKDKYGV